MARKPVQSVPSDPDPLDKQLPAPQKKRSRWLYILGAIAVLFVCGVIGSLFTDDAAEEPTPTAAVAQSAATEEPTEEPTEQPTEAPRATETLPALPTIESIRDLAAAELTLQNALDQALGESNRGLGRKLDLFSPGLPGLIENSIIIGWAADEAASPTLIRETMARDTLTVLQAVADSGIDYDVVLIGAKYPMMIEQLNMVDEVEVLTLQYDRDTLAAIDWNTITPSEIFQIADLFIIHPDFEE
jgi:hypothetical protein